MSVTYNVYCDESCHLPHDQSKVMTLGAVWCQKEKARAVTKRIREIKAKHGLKPFFEIKWDKVSPSKLNFFLDIVDYFFDDADLRFRALVIPDKTLLRHEAFNQDHDGWYYKMYFNMLKVILEPEHRYRIYIDIKDTRGREKIQKLHEVLSNNIYDFDRRIIEKVQSVHSHEITQVQLADLLMGAITYVNRGLSDSKAKLAVIEKIRHRSGKSLQKRTLLRENKLNLFFWQAEAPSE